MPDAFNEERVRAYLIDKPNLQSSIRLASSFAFTISLCSCTSFDFTCLFFVVCEYSNPYNNFAQFCHKRASYQSDFLLFKSALAKDYILSHWHAIKWMESLKFLNECHNTDRKKRSRKKEKKWQKNTTNRNNWNLYIVSFEVVKCYRFEKCCSNILYYSICMLVEWNE